MKTWFIQNPNKNVIDGFSMEILKLCGALHSCLHPWHVILLQGDPCSVAEPARAEPMFFGWSRSRNFGSAPAALAWFQSFATLYLLRISTFYEKFCRKFRIRYRDCCHKSFKPVLYPVLRIRIYYYVDPDPGSQKCPYGSGSKGVNTKEEK